MSENNENKQSRALKWFEILAAATVVYIVAVLLGGSSSRGGSIIAVGSYVLFLVALVNAARQGMQPVAGATPTSQSKTIALIIAFVVTFLVLGIGAQINNAADSDTSVINTNQHA